MREVLRVGEQIKVIEDIFGLSGIAMSSLEPDVAREPGHLDGDDVPTGTAVVADSQVLVLFERLGVAAFAVSIKGSVKYLTATSALECLLQADGKDISNLEQL